MSRRLPPSPLPTDPLSALPAKLQRRICLDLSRFAAAGTFHGAVTWSPAQSFQTVSALVTIPGRGLLKTVLKTETLKPKHPR